MTSSPPRLVALHTPEGVALPLTLAGIGERLGAFVLDSCIIGFATAVAGFVAGVALLLGAVSVLGVLLVASFLLRNLYFAVCEVGWSGMTLGKRAMGLRVIARDGGSLTAGAAFARNLMREVELFVPLTVLLAPRAVLGGGPVWIAFVSGAWLFVFAALPFFGRDRLRCGDLVAGTLVVRLPRAVLLPDLTEAAEAQPWRAERGIRFTAEQLDLYGITQLQLLEKVLRESHRNRDAMAPLAERIQRKIGWAAAPGAAVEAEEFLRAFYTAQRARLEYRLLLGERRQDKRAGRLTRKP